MPTNQQRRDEERRRLKQELEQRRDREDARKRTTLIVSIVATLAVVAAVLVIVLTNTNSSDKKKAPAAAKPPASTSTPTPTPTPTAPASSSAPPVREATGPSVTFDGVTVSGARDVKGEPGVTSKSSTDPKKLEYKDLVVGKGAAAALKQTVSAQYVVSFYKSGKLLQSSWQTGQPITTPLTKGTQTSPIEGFVDAIAGTTGVPPMKAGGRRVVVLPANLAYGATGQPQGGIPPNTSLVFVIDLTKVS